ncbi:MAG: hypothetical protein ABIZ64_10310 [Casimicrobium sp.]
MKTTFFRASHILSMFAAALGVTSAHAATPARPDKIMTIAELRTCMKLEYSNKKAAEEILQEQETFKRDQAAVKAEQAEVSKTNDEIRANAATITTEREILSGLIAGLSTKSAAAKTDEEKAAVEAERLGLIERNRAFEQSTDRFNATQQVQRERVTALNARIAAINERNRTVNDRVEPHQKQAARWRDECSNRRFREEEEVVIKKEIAAGK